MKEPLVFGEADPKHYVLPPADCDVCGHPIGDHHEVGCVGETLDPTSRVANYRPCTCAEYIAPPDDDDD